MEITSTRESTVLWDNDYWEKVRQRTLKVIACIPPEKYDWRYAEGKFSFADIIRHLATIERYMYAENAQLKPSRYPGHDPDLASGTHLADGPENVMAFFNRMHQESMAIFSRLSADDLQKKCVTPGGTPITVWKWLRAMVEHEVHHRSQIYTYLGMLGIPTPPIYGLTSEEVKERSQPATR
ncbi:MAG TPA: DinB family protein [Candidatus Angelobacter sp.]